MVDPLILRVPSVLKMARGDPSRPPTPRTSTLPRRARRIKAQAPRLSLLRAQSAWPPVEPCATRNEWDAHVAKIESILEVVDTFDLVNLRLALADLEVDLDIEIE